MLSAFSYLHRFLDPTDPSASLRHAMYALVIVAGTAYLGLDLLWHWIHGAPSITSDWGVSFGILVGGVTAGKLGGQKLNNSAEKPPDEAKE